MNRTFSRLFRSGAAGLLALLFAGGNALALSWQCMKLGQGADDLFIQPVQPLPESSRKPQNVTVAYKGYDGYTVSWNIPAGFPRGVLTGFCVRVSDDRTDDTEEKCGSDVRPFQHIIGCFYENRTLPRCPHPSDVNFEVKFQTECDVELPWSDKADSPWQ